MFRASLVCTSYVIGLGRRSPGISIDKTTDDHGKNLRNPQFLIEEVKLERKLTFGEKNVILKIKL